MGNAGKQWTFERNPGGASLMFNGVYVAHVGNVYCSSLQELGIPENGMSRAKWMCGLLNAPAEKMKEKEAVS